MGTQARTKSSRLGYAFDDFTESHIRSPSNAGAGTVALMRFFVSVFRNFTSWAMNPGCLGASLSTTTVHGRPSAVRVDNGPEFTAQPFVDWCAEHGVRILYIQPGKPDQNAYIERFNRSYRTEVLNAHLFESLGELRAITDQWLRVYNQERPHDSLGRVPPLTFLPRPTIAGKSPGNCPLDGGAYGATGIDAPEQTSLRGLLTTPRSQLN